MLLKTLDWFGKLVGLELTMLRVSLFGRSGVKNVAKSSRVFLIVQFYLTSKVTRFTCPLHKRSFVRWLIVRVGPTNFTRPTDYNLICGSPDLIT